MKKVLFITYMHRHLKKIIPIIKELKKAASQIDVNVVALTDEEKRLTEDNGIECALLDKFCIDKKRNDFDIAWALNPMINCIDSIKPDLFIATEVNYILRNAIRYCKQKNIPNIVLQHGTPNKYSLHAFAPFEGDCFLAWGDFSKDFLVSNHVDPARIIVTGGVNFDNTLSLQPNKDIIALTLGIESDKKWIVFTTQGSGAGDMPTEDEIFTGITETVKHMTQYNEYQLIFQVHPGQKVEEVKEIVDKVSGHTAIVVKYTDTEELIAASDGIITFFSTTSIDAIILGKPLLLINLSNDKDLLPFARIRAAFGAYKKEDIGLQLDNLLFNSDTLKDAQRNAALSVNYMNDGKALERILAICYNKLNLKFNGE